MFPIVPPALDSRLQAHRPPEARPLGWSCFQLGMLLVASSAFLAAIPLLVALILGSCGRRSPLEDRLNQVLLGVSILMLLGCFVASSGWLAWVGLGNWLPFFWAFWGFQPYLATASARRRGGRTAYFKRLIRLEVSQRWPPICCTSA